MTTVDDIMRQVLEGDPPRWVAAQSVNGLWVVRDTWCPGDFAGFYTEAEARAEAWRRNALAFQGTPY
jgi:hypothetical protein